jgi:energy-coupling factor transport system ATP-binding protein
LRALAGLHEPTRGSVTAVRGGDGPRPGRDVALCPQNPDDVLYRDRVLDEVRTTIEARSSGLDPMTVLAGLDIADLADRHPRDLSAGQRLLIATAAIVATGAPVLLLDEPTRGLDPRSKQQLADFFRAHAGPGCTVVFASHDVELVASVATRVVMLADGDRILDADPVTALGDSQVFAPQMTRVFGPGWLTPDQVADALHGPRT